MIGSGVVRKLLDLNADVVCFILDATPQSELIRSGDINRTSVVNGDLKDFWAVERAVNEYEVDTIIHLGAQTIVGTAHRFPLPTLETNIRGTYNVLEAARLHSDLVCRLVVASSDKAYGEQAELPYTEDTPLGATFPYDVSKACADLVAQMYYTSFELPVAIARCGNVYGEGDLNWSRIVPGTIRALLNRESPVIRSDGNYVRDYIYLGDVVNAYLELADVSGDSGVSGQSFNFSNETPVTVLQMVEEVASVLRVSDIAPTILDETHGEIHSQYLSSAKARRVLGWTANFSLRQGLEATTRWYRQLLGL
jgi:CDP-glucose 4,6-dehydratase